MIQRAGETRPTNDEPVRAPIDGTGDLADYFVPASKPQFSNPIVRPAPSGPEPTNSPEVPEDLPKPRGGESPMAPPLTTANTFSMDRLSSRAAQTRAPLGPISITIWGAETKPAIIIYWQSRLPKSWLRAFEPAVPSGGSHHCPRHQTIRGSGYSQWRPLFPAVCLSLEWRYPRYGGWPKLPDLEYTSLVPETRLPQTSQRSTRTRLLGFLSPWSLWGKRHRQWQSALAKTAAPKSHLKNEIQRPGTPLVLLGTQRIPSCARPVPVPIDARPYGRPKPFRHGAGRWVSPWYTSMSVNLDNLLSNPQFWQQTCRYTIGKVCTVPTRSTNVHQEWTHQTWVDIHRRWCKVSAQPSSNTSPWRDQDLPWTSELIAYNRQGRFRSLKWGIVHPPHQHQGYRPCWIQPWWCALASKFAHYAMEEENRVRVGLHHPWESQPHHSWTWERKSLDLLPVLLIRYLNLFTARTNTIPSHLPCWHRLGRLFQAPIRTLLLTDNRFSWTTFGQWQRWPMIQTPNTLRSWKMGCHWEWTTPQESRHLAYQGRVKRWEPSRGSLGGPTRTWKLCISGDPCRGYSEDLFGGTGYGHGPWSPYCPGSGIHLWMWHTGIMPRPYGSYRWRRQNSYHLWWILGRCKCPHPGQYRRTHYSPHSHGLPPRHSLAAGVTEGTWPQETPLCTLGLAQTRWPVDALEGRRYEGS